MYSGCWTNGARSFHLVATNSRHVVGRFRDFLSVLIDFRQNGEAGTTTYYTYSIAAIRRMMVVRPVKLAGSFDEASALH